MLKIGIEIERLAIKNNEPIDVTNYIPTDAFGYLSEIRSDPYDKPGLLYGDVLDKMKEMDNNQYIKKEHIKLTTICYPFDITNY